MSEDNRFAAAYTNYNQTILFNAVTSEFIVIDNPLKGEQTVQGVLLNDNRLFIYGQYSWCVYSITGTLLETKEVEGNHESFPILSMRIVSSPTSAPDAGISNGGDAPKLQRRLRKVLSMKSIPQSKDTSNLFILRWSGDMEDDNLLLENHKGECCSHLTCHGGFVMNEKNTKIWTCRDLTSNDVGMYVFNDGTWTKKADYVGNQFDMLQLSLSSDESYLIGAFTDGFQLWKTTGCEGEGLVTLKLPSTIRNVTSKMNRSNECLLSKGNIWAIAGVRKVAQNSYRGSKNSHNFFMY